MEKLLKKYDIHIQNYVKKMTKFPFKINNYKINSMTTRQKLFADSSSKILDKKGFSFKNFKTDKERIKAYIQEKEAKNKNNSFNNKKRDKLKLKLKKIFLYENQDNGYNEDFKKIMKVFKKNDNELNDKEKILYENIKSKYDELTLNDINNLDEDEKDNENDIKNKKINNLFYNKKDILKIINNTSINDEDKYKKLLHNKIYNERKNMLLLRKLKLKYQNKLNRTNSTFFPKSNFKALENLILFKSPLIKPKINKTLSSKEINQNESSNNKKIFNQTMTSKFKERKFKNNINNNTNFNKYSMDIKNYKNNNFKIFESNNILSDISLRKEIVGINPLLYQYNMNFIKNLDDKKEKDVFFRDKINSLKKMAFQQNDENDFDIKYEKKIYEIIKQNEEIFANKKKRKENSIDKIVDKLLKKCNYKPDIDKNKKILKE